MCKFFLFTLFVGLLSLSACAPVVASVPSSGGSEIIVNETTVSDKTEAEEIYINNCGNLSDSEQISERSQTVSVEGGGSLGVNIEVIEASVQGKYISTNGVSKSQKVTASPNTNMKFVLLWTEHLKEGVITVDGHSGEANYLVTVPIAVEQASAENLGCPMAAESPSSTSTADTAQPSLSVTQVNVAPLTQNTNPGTVLEVGQSWTSENMTLTLADVEFYPQGDWGFCYVGLSFYLENNSILDRTITVNPSNFVVSDNLGRQDIQHSVSSGYYPCPPLDSESFSEFVGAGKRFPNYDYWYVGISADITNTSLGYLIVTVNNLSVFSGASWRIPIYH